MKKLLFITLVTLTSACASGGYHVEAGPTGVMPIFGRNVDVVLTNQCAPVIRYYTAGVSRDSVVGHLYYGGHTTVRLVAPYFSDQYGAQLPLVVDIYRSENSAPVASAKREYLVNTYTSGKIESWIVSSQSGDRCPTSGG